MNYDENNFIKPLKRFFKNVRNFNGIFIKSFTCNQCVVGCDYP